MKLTKNLCLVAATAALALAPINTSNGQANTVLASQPSCTYKGKGWYHCTDGQGKYWNEFDHQYQPPHRPSWLNWLNGAFYVFWTTLTSWFK